MTTLKVFIPSSDKPGTDRRRCSEWCRSWAGLIVVFASTASTGTAKDPMKLESTAPPNHVSAGSAPGGSYFVAKDLKQRYDDLLARMRVLRAVEKSDPVGGPDAREQLRSLQPKLDELRKEIETKKVRVSPVTPKTETQETTFDLAADRLLVVTADNLRLRGWDQPRVKCVLESMVLSTDDESAVNDLRAVQLVHRQGTAPDLVGTTLAEYGDAERAFLASEAGRALTDAQLESRRILGNEIRDSYAPYRDFQGKVLDVLEIEGLTAAQGNQQIVIGITSDDAGSLASHWRRHAKLTVYVPRCRGVLLRGCLVGVDVENVQAPLTITDSGSRDRDYAGVFTVRDVDGPFRIFNVPLDRLERVHGDVTIMSTVGFANTGVHHKDGWRIGYPSSPHECTISGIDGDLSAWFTRETLSIERVAGQIDVTNEAGDTTLTLAELSSNAAHRVISDSGVIEVRTSAAVLGTLSVMAVTDQGSVRTNAAREVLDDVNFSTGDPLDGSRRSWRGLKTKRNFDPASFLKEARRPADVLANEPRSAGFDLISRSGAVVVAVGP